MKKSIILMLLCIALILTMVVGCNSQQSSSTTGGTTIGSTTTAGTTASQTQTVAETSAGGELPVITAFWRDTINPPGASRITQYLEEKIGIKFQTIDVPIGDYDTKLNMAIASGDLPDLFQSYGPDNAVLYKLLDEKMILPIDSYLDKYPNVKSYVNQEYHKLYAYINNQCVGIPREYGFYSAGIYYRKDLLDKYKLEVPVTLEDYYNAMKVITENEGIYGMTSIWGLWSLNNIFGAYNGLGQSGWVEKDGKYVDVFVLPETREAVKYISRMYDEKILDPEFMVISDFDQYLEKFYTGKVASIFAHVESQDYYNRIMLQTEAQMPESEVVAYFTQEGPKGTKTHSFLPFSTVLHINAKSKYPEKILEMYDFLLSAQGEEFLLYGIEGVHYTKGTDGAITVNNEEIAKDVVDPASDPLNKFRWYSRILPGVFPENAIDRDWQIEIYQHNQDNGTYSPVIGFFSENLTRYSPEYDKIRNEAYVKFITGELNIDEDWDKTVQSFIDAGYGIVEAEVNEFMSKK